MIQISPSLLSADFSRLGDEVKAVTDAGADIIHFDVMDGHFVPNITFGPMILKAIRKCSPLPFEAHLMISEPQRYWKNFADAGADIIGIHIESVLDHASLIREIRSAGKKVCLTINPPTPVECLEPFIALVDEILVMTVNPGFGGQKFIEEIVSKIARLDEIRRQKKTPFLIEVDGGINRETSRIVREAGADVIVTGNYIFSHKDYRSRIEEVRCG